jgi:CheY-like chemotaxis protein
MSFAIDSQSLSGLRGPRPEPGATAVPRGRPVARLYRGIVFVTDDEDAFRDSTKDLLQDSGYLVLSARTGTEALARMRGIVGPAVALLDLVMPGMDGWHLIRTMRADADLRRIPIVVLSAHVGESVEGADRVLRKPYNVTTLLETLEELCR